MLQALVGCYNTVVQPTLASPTPLGGEQGKKWDVPLAVHTAGSTEVTSPVASTGAKRHAGVGRGEGPAGGIARSDMKTRALPWQLHLQPPSQGPLAALGRQWSVRDGGHIPLLHRVWILISASNVRREALALAPCGAGSGSYAPHPIPPPRPARSPPRVGRGKGGGGQTVVTTLLFNQLQH